MIATLGGGALAGTPGRGLESAALLVVAVELDNDGHPQHVRFDAIDDIKGSSTMANWVTIALHSSVHLVTDWLASFNAAGAAVAKLGSIIVGPIQSSDLNIFRWLNTFISNLKTANHGIFITSISRNAGAAI